VVNPILARLRAAGRIDCPVAGVVGPLGGHEFWVQPRLDLHLIPYPEAAAAVRRLAKGAQVEPIRPLVHPEFFERGLREQTRAAFGVPQQARLVLVSGGGWGAGDIEGALEACLSLPGVRVLAVCGRNEPLRRRLARRYEGDERVTPLGFTTRMRDLLWAADALITATAGMSCLEARLCGCPIISYGFPVGHVRDNTRALVRHGLACSATSGASLRELTRTTLSHGRNAIPPLSELPSAAELTVALARSSVPRRRACVICG
jgi:UDP-N-acetylglucosamine:LPS N-acetylglucosamine transferase